MGGSAVERSGCLLISDCKHGWFITKSHPPPGGGHDPSTGMHCIPVVKRVSWSFTLVPRWSTGTSCQWWQANIRSIIYFIEHGTLVLFPTLDGGANHIARPLRAEVGANREYSTKADLLSS